MSADEERLEFKVGDRVHLSELGQKHARLSDRKGVVAGLPKCDTQCRVQWDGLKTPQLLHRTYLERERATRPSQPIRNVFA